MPGSATKGDQQHMIDGDLGLMDALRDAGLERLRFSRRPEGTRVVAARSEGGWELAADLLPRAAAGIDRVRELFERGGHERLDLVFRAEIGLRFLCAVHSTRRGPGAGGLRRHDLVTPELEVVADVLGLARAMTYKNAAAGLDRGGSKLCVHNPGIPQYDREPWLTTLAEEIELSGTITGPDTGYDTETYLDLAERTDLVTGIRDGGTTRSAAYGVFLGVRGAAAALGIPLSEATVVIQGLGGIGSALAESLLHEGASLAVTDRDHRCLEAFFSGLTPTERSRVNVVAPYQILEAEGDVLAPCAMGGILTTDSIDSLKVRAIAGGANNQLAGGSLAEEIELARRLRDRGILFVPDWLVSIGGTIHGVLEYEQGEAFDPRNARARIRRIAGWATDEILEQAKNTGRTPLEIAAERFLEGEAGLVGHAS